MKILPIKTKSKQYKIYIGENILGQINKIFKKEDINFKKSLIIVDKKVPKIFIKKIKSVIKSEKKIIYLFLKIHGVPNLMLHLLLQQSPLYLLRQLDRH